MYVHKRCFIQKQQKKLKGLRLYCCPITQQEKNLNKVSGDHILDIRNDIYWNKLELFHKNETSEKLSFNFEENTIF